MIKARTAKFQIGQVVRHRIFSFRGVIFDIDPEFNNTEEWWLSIPEEVRPPAVLRRARSLFRKLKETEGLSESGLARLLDDPVLAREHRRMLPPPRRRGHDPIDVPLLIAFAHIEEADAIVAAWNAMSREERVAALSNTEAFERLLALAWRE